jgi:hypothetical protein
MFLHRVWEQFSNFANGYDINALRMSSFYTTFCGRTKLVLRLRVCWTSTTVTFGYGIILILSANVGIKSASASAFGLVSSGTLWAPICYLTGWLLGDIVIFWSSSALWGRCPAVVERDVSGKVDGTWRADCMASSVAGSNSDGFSSCGDTWKSKFTQSFPGLSKVS